VPSQAISGETGRYNHRMRDANLTATLLLAAVIVGVLARIVFF
jgi:hypothetical protein